MQDDLDEDGGEAEEDSDEDVESESDGDVEVIKEGDFRSASCCHHAMICCWSTPCCSP